MKCDPGPSRPGFALSIHQAQRATWKQPEKRGRAFMANGGPTLQPCRRGKGGSSRQSAHQPASTRKVPACGPFIGRAAGRRKAKSRSWVKPRVAGTPRAPAKAPAKSEGRTAAAIGISCRIVSALTEFSGARSDIRAQRASDPGGSHAKRSYRSDCCRCDSARDSCQYRCRAQKTGPQYRDGHEPDPVSGSNVCRHFGDFRGPLEDPRQHGQVAAKS